MDDTEHPAKFDIRKEASLYADFVTGEYFANGKPITREGAFSFMGGGWDRTTKILLYGPDLTDAELLDLTAPASPDA